MTGMNSWFHMDGVFDLGQTGQPGFTMNALPVLPTQNAAQVTRETEDQKSDAARISEKLKGYRTSLKH